MKSKHFSRRQALGAFAYLGIASACTPIKVLLADKKPPDYTFDTTLRAFMETIIPGIPVDALDLTSIFYDAYFPFYSYKEILAEDLDKSSFSQYRVKRFYDLELAQREEIIERKLKKKGITQQLYVAAIWLTQLTIYTGNYNSEGECYLIDFKCMDSKTDSYANLTTFLGEPATKNGNPS